MCPARPGRAWARRSAASQRTRRAARRACRAGHGERAGTSRRARRSPPGRRRRTRSTSHRASSSEPTVIRACAHELRGRIELDAGAHPVDAHREVGLARPRRRGQGGQAELQRAVEHRDARRPVAARAAGRSRRPRPRPLRSTARPTGAERRPVAQPADRIIARCVGAGAVVRAACRDRRRRRRPSPVTAPVACALTEQPPRRGGASRPRGPPGPPRCRSRRRCSRTPGSGGPRRIPSRARPAVRSRRPAGGRRAAAGRPVATAAVLVDGRRGEGELDEAGRRHDGRAVHDVVAKERGRRPPKVVSHTGPRLRRRAHSVAQQRVAVRAAPETGSYQKRSRCHGYVGRSTGRRGPANTAAQSIVDPAGV